MPKRNKYNLRDFFGGTIRYGNNVGPMGEVLPVDKECNFPNFRTELLISKLIASITDKQLQDKFLKEKDLDVPKTIEQLQQKTYDREKKKIAILEALI